MLAYLDCMAVSINLFRPLMVIFIVLSTGTPLAFDSPPPGKTLSVVAFTVTLLTCPTVTALQNLSSHSSSLQSSASLDFSLTYSTQSERDKSSDRKLIQSVLVLTPVNTLQNWRKEYDSWTPHGLKSGVPVTVISSTDADEPADDPSAEDSQSADVGEPGVKNPMLERIRKLKKWYNTGGVLVMGYEMFRTLVDEESYSKKGLTQKDYSRAVRYMLRPGPDVIVADEAHIIKVGNS